MGSEEYKNYCRNNNIRIDQNVSAALEKSEVTGEISLMGITLGTCTCQALGHAIQMREGVLSLDVSNCLLPPAGLCLLLDLLANARLTLLNLKGNNIFGPGTVALSKMISKNNRLKILILEWNNLGQPLVAFSQFANALLNNTTLEVLDLKNNSLSCECAKELADVIARNTSLKEIEVQDGAVKWYRKTLSNVWFCTDMKKDLRWNSMGVEGGQYLLKAMQTNKTLNTIKVQGNDIPADITSAIEEMVNHNTTIQRLQMEQKMKQDLLTRHIQSINQQRVDDFKMVCEQSRLQLEPALEKLKRFAADKTRLMEEMERSKERSARQDEEVSDLNHRLARALKQLENAEATIRERDEQLVNVEAQHKIQLIEIKSKFAEQEKRLKMDLNDGEALLLSEQANRDQLLFKLSESGKEVETLAAQMDVLKEKLQHITTVHSKILDEERRLHKQSLEKLMDELKQQQNQTSQMIDDAQSTASEKIKTLERKLLDSEKLNAQLSVQLVADKTKWIEEKSKIIDDISAKQDDKVKHLNEKLEMMREENQKLHYELGSTRSDVVRLNNELQSLRNQIGEKDHRIQLIQQELSEEKMSVKQAKREACEMGISKDMLEQECARYKSELHATHQQVLHLNGELERLKSELSKQIDSLTSKLQTKDEEINAIRNEELDRARSLYAAVNKYLGNRVTL